MPGEKTHREVKNPEISARYLADYMASSQKAGRSLIRNCRYKSIARVIQHNSAKAAVSRFLRGAQGSLAKLAGTAETLRNRMADSNFERDLLDHNADYIERFAKVSPNVALPDAEIFSPGKHSPIKLGGVKVSVEVFYRFRRLTKTNKIRIGIGALRYSKGKPLPTTVGEWQSAFLFGYLNDTNAEEEAEPEHKLCVTVDAYSGKVYSAPSNSIRRYQNMEAACESIAERWPNIQPPPEAKF